MNDEEWMCSPSEIWRIIRLDCVDQWQSVCSHFFQSNQLKYKRTNTTKTLSSIPTFVILGFLTLIQGATSQDNTFCNLVANYVFELESITAIASDHGDWPFAKRVWSWTFEASIWTSTLDQILLPKMAFLDKLHKRQTKFRDSDNVPVVLLHGWCFDQQEGAGRFPFLGHCLLQTAIRFFEISKSTSLDSEI